MTSTEYTYLSRTLKIIVYAKFEKGEKQYSLVQILTVKLTHQKVKTLF